MACLGGTGRRSLDPLQVRWLCFTSVVGQGVCMGLEAKPIVSPACVEGLPRGLGDLPPGSGCPFPESLTGSGDVSKVLLTKFFPRARSPRAVRLGNKPHTWKWLLGLAGH